MADPEDLKNEKNQKTSQSIGDYRKKTNINKLQITHSSFSIFPSNINDNFYEPTSIDLNPHDDVTHCLALSNPILSMLNPCEDMKKIEEIFVKLNTSDILENTSSMSVSSKMASSESKTSSNCESYFELKRSEMVKYSLEIVNEYCQAGYINK